MSNTKKTIISALCLALSLLLPFLTGQIPQFGRALAPMHIGVFLCGLLCGSPYGMLVGFIAPYLRFMLFQTPAIFPMGFAMSFELLTYGLIAGLLYRKHKVNIYISLITSMLFGRLVYGAVMYAIMFFTKQTYTLQMFIASAFTTAIPGIILHIALVPLIVIALRKSGIVK
ncbi:MAG: ECF transporter S component [Oscillospiraceae bacterium]